MEELLKRILHRLEVMGGHFKELLDEVRASPVASEVAHVAADVAAAIVPSPAVKAAVAILEHELAASSAPAKICALHELEHADGSVCGV